MNMRSFEIEFTTAGQELGIQSVLQKSIDHWKNANPAQKMKFNADHAAVSLVFNYFKYSRVTETIFATEEDREEAYKMSNRVSKDTLKSRVKHWTKPVVEEGRKNLDLGSRISVKMAGEDTETIGSRLAKCMEAAEASADREGKSWKLESRGRYIHEPSNSMQNNIFKRISGQVWYQAGRGVKRVFRDQNAEYFRKRWVNVVAKFCKKSSVYSGKLGYDKKQIRAYMHKIFNPKNLKNQRVKFEDLVESLRAGDARHVLRTSIFQQDNGVDDDGDVGAQGNAQEGFQAIQQLAPANQEFFQLQRSLVQDPVEEQNLDASNQEIGIVEESVHDDEPALEQTESLKPDVIEVQAKEANNDIVEIEASESFRGVMHSVLNNHMMQDSDDEAALEEAENSNQMLSRLTEYYNVPKVEENGTN
jgi:hypothetical protein